jgi:hypothetical protein
MRFLSGPRIRHPFFPGLNPTPASEAKGSEPALFGALKDLEQAADRGVSAKRAVFVLLDPAAPPFTPAERDRLWDLFRTPVYAILTGPNGRVTAFECEVQNGFHLAAKGNSGAGQVCECGRPGPMLDARAVRAIESGGLLSPAAS